MTTQIQQLLDAVRESSPEIIGAEDFASRRVAFEKGWNANADRLFSIAQEACNNYERLQAVNAQLLEALKFVDAFDRSEDWAIEEIQEIYNNCLECEKNIDVFAKSYVRNYVLAAIAAAEAKQPLYTTLNRRPD